LTNIPLPFLSGSDPPVLKFDEWTDRLCAKWYLVSSELQRGKKRKTKLEDEFVCWLASISWKEENKKKKKQWQEELLSAMRQAAGLASWLDRPINVGPYPYYPSAQRLAL
jgi:hypothetical protein